MNKKKIVLHESIVKYIFPGTNPAVALGEDGYIIYDFDRFYPDKLGIFLPTEIEHSDYSSILPKPFESYFLNADSEIDYLSRFLEVDITHFLSGSGVEYAPGKVLIRDDSDYTIFRVDELLDPKAKIDLLCRVKLSSLEIDDEIAILETNPYFRGDATDLTGVRYYYWIMPISKLFQVTDEMISSIFTFANSFHQNKDPF